MKSNGNGHRVTDRFEVSNKNRWPEQRPGLSPAMRGFLAGVAYGFAVGILIALIWVRYW